MILFWLPEGPRIRYERDALDEMLIIEDLNPGNELHFLMSPVELFFFGLRCVWASIWP